VRRTSQGFPIWLTLFVALIVSATHREVAAQAPNQVALVVQTEPGVYTTHCIPFSEAEISGLEVLLRSGLNIVYRGGSSMGAAVCKIGDRGCDNPANCFCECRGAACLYWSYWHLMGAEWQYAALGASYAVRPGAVVGWVWGIGTPSDAPEPPSIRFADVCQPATSTPPPTPTSTATDTPLPTGTPLPTRTPSPTATLAAASPTALAPTSPTPTVTLSLQATLSATPTMVPSATPTTATRTSTATPASPPTAATSTTEGEADERSSPDLRSYAIFGGMAVLLVLFGLVVKWRQR